LNCDGLIEEWEKSTDIARVIYGSMGMMATAFAFFHIFSNEWEARLKWKFDNLFAIANALHFIFAMIFPLFQLIWWWGSYSDNLWVIDAFYYWSHVNTWYLATFYWLWQILFLAWIAKESDYTNSYKDHALTIMMTNVVFGIAALVLQTVWADRLNLWYVKTQFLAGRTVNESKNNVWGYLGSLGSTARTWYNYTPSGREAQEPLELVDNRVEEAEETVEDNMFDF
jgi:hypothetical protein